MIILQQKINFLQVGDIEEITIGGMGHTGEGIGRAEGVAVFVPGALPGETVKVRIDQVKKNYARGELLEIIQKASARISSRCPFTKACGGCHLQHLDYQEQLRHKREMVLSALKRIGGLENIEVLTTLGMDDPWHYRNKVHLQVKKDGNRIQLGFFADGTHQMVAEVAKHKCLLVHEKMNQIMATLQELINTDSLSVYCWKRKEGLLRHVMIRRGYRSGQVMVVFVTSPEEWPGAKKLAKDLIARHPEVTSVIRNINHQPGRAVLGRENHLLAGEESIMDWIEDLKFKISASSFYQVNSIQTEALYGKVLEYAGLQGDETVVDAYCGIGTIALFLARHAGEMIGLEIVEQAVEDARQNALLNNLTNTRFYSGPVEKLLPQMASKGQKADVVILDPPRKGCAREVLNAVTAMQVPRIVYVSCDPATLARDLGILSKMGYQAAKVQPVDMFPWTSHCEVVVLLVK